MLTFNSPFFPEMQIGSSVTGGFESRSDSSTLRLCRAMIFD